jgi:hypothetical protein
LRFRATARHGENDRPEHRPDQHGVGADGLVDIAGEPFPLAVEHGRDLAEGKTGEERHQPRHEQHENQAQKRLPMPSPSFERWET